DGRLLAGRSALLEPLMEPELLWEPVELLFEVPGALVAWAWVCAFEPVEVPPLDLPGKACAATSARSAVSARLPAISQRLARPKRRRAASRVWVVCWRIVVE